MGNSTEPELEYDERYDHLRAEKRAEYLRETKHIMRMNSINREIAAVLTKDFNCYRSEMGSVCATPEAAELQKQLRNKEKELKQKNAEILTKEGQLQKQAQEMERLKQETKTAFWKSRFGMEVTPWNIGPCYQITRIEPFTLASQLGLQVNDYIYAFLVYEHKAADFWVRSASHRGELLENLFKFMLDKYSSPEPHTILVFYSRNQICNVAKLVNTQKTPEHAADKPTTVPAEKATEGFCELG